MLITCNIDHIMPRNMFLCDAFNKDCLDLNDSQRWFNIFVSVCGQFSAGVILIIISSILIFIWIENQYIAYNFYNGWRYVNFAKKFTDDQIVHILMLSVARDRSMLDRFNDNIKKFLGDRSELGKKICAAFGCCYDDILAYKLVENLGNLNLFLYRTQKSLESNTKYLATRDVVCAFMRSLSPVDFSIIIEYYYRSIVVFDNDSYRYSPVDKLYQYVNLKDKLNVDSTLDVFNKKYELYNIKAYNTLNIDSKKFFVKNMKDLFDLKKASRIDKAYIENLILHNNPIVSQQSVALLNVAMPILKQFVNLNNINQNANANPNNNVQTLQYDKKKVEVQEILNCITYIYAANSPISDILGSYDSLNSKFDKINDLHVNLNFLKNANLNFLKNMDISNIKNNKFSDDDLNNVMNLVAINAGYSDKEIYVNLKKYNNCLNMRNVHDNNVYLSQINMPTDMKKEDNNSDLLEIGVLILNFLSKVLSSNDAVIITEIDSDLLDFYLKLVVYENADLLDVKMGVEGINQGNEVLRSLIASFVLSDKFYDKDNKKQTKTCEAIDKIFGDNLFASPLLYFIQNKLLEILVKAIKKIIRNLPVPDFVDASAWRDGIFGLSQNMGEIVHFPLFFYDLLFIVNLLVLPFIIPLFYDFEEIALNSVMLMNKDILSVRDNILTDLAFNLSSFVSSSYVVLSIACMFMCILFRSIVHYEVSGYGFGDLLCRLTPIVCCCLLLIFDGNSLDYVERDEIIVDLSDKIRLIQEYNGKLNSQINITVDRSEYNSLYVLVFILSLICCFAIWYFNIDKILQFSFIIECDLNSFEAYLLRLKALSKVFLSKDRPESVGRFEIHFKVLLFIILWNLIFIILYMPSRGFKRSIYYFLSSFEFFSNVIRSREEIESLCMIDDFRDVHLKIKKYVLFRLDKTKYQKAFFYKFNSLMLSADFDGMIEHINTLNDDALRDELLKSVNDPNNLLLHDINFKIIPGNILAYVNGYEYTIPTDICELHGISGSGKSTILKKLIGLQNTKYCMINDSINNKDLHDFSRYLMPVFDVASTYCVNYFTLDENFNIANAKYSEYVYKILKDMNMSQYADSFNIPIKNMFFSVGQRSRIDLIRWLLSVKNLPTGASCAIYADEPLASLDDNNSRSFLDVTIDMARDKKLVFLSVDHSGIVNEYASTLMEINNKTIEYFVKDSNGDWRSIESLFANSMQLESNLGNKVIRRIKVDGNYGAKKKDPKRIKFKAKILKNDSLNSVEDDLLNSTFESDNNESDIIDLSEEKTLVNYIDSVNSSDLI